MKISFFSNMKLKNKIAIASIFLVLASNMVLALFSFKYITEKIKDTAYSNSMDMSVQVGNFFDQKIGGIIQRVYAMRSNELFNPDSYLSKFLMNDEYYYHALALSNISAALTEVRMSDDYVSSLYIYTPKGDFYDLSQVKKPGFDFKNTALYRQIQKERQFTILWGDISKDEIYTGQKEVLPLVIPFNVEGYSGDCYIIVNLNKETIIKYLKNVYSKGGSDILILENMSHEILCESNNINTDFIKESSLLSLLDVEKKGFTNLKYEGHNYIVSFNSTNVSPWNIVFIGEEKELLSSIDKAKLYMFILTGICLILTLLISVIVSRSITKPLGLLEKTIKNVTNRDFNAKFCYEYDDEVGRLGRSFNFMMEEINDLITRLNSTIGELHNEKDRVKMEQQLKRKAELMALQAQINPHFLYNTLNSIVWMADKVNAKDISYMAASLGKLFQISLSKGKELIPISSEIEHVSSYLSIQKIRYTNKLNYNIDIDKEMLGSMIIKLVLQPFVENSIYHGIKEKEGTGNIEILGSLSESGEQIEFQVIDDGMGMSSGQVELINKRLERGALVEQEGYGIYNVNERIKMYFGKEYGVRFESELGKGTKVTIIIPAL